MEKALGLHCLALRSGIEWRGQLPRPAMRLELVDTDGDRPPASSRFKCAWGEGIGEVGGRPMCCELFFEEVAFGDCFLLPSPGTGPVSWKVVGRSVGRLVG